MPIAQLVGTAQKVRNVPATLPGTAGGDIYSHRPESLRPSRASVPWSKGSLVFSLPGSWMPTHRKPEGEESRPWPASATAGSCLSDLGMWSRSQLPGALGPEQDPPWAATQPRALLHQPFCVPRAPRLSN